MAVVENQFIKSRKSAETQQKRMLDAAMGPDVGAGMVLASREEDID